MAANASQVRVPIGAVCRSGRVPQAPRSAHPQDRMAMLVRLRKIPRPARPPGEPLPRSIERMSLRREGPVTERLLTLVQGHPGADPALAGPLDEPIAAGSPMTRRQAVAIFES